MLYLFIISVCLGRSFYCVDFFNGLIHFLRDFCFLVFIGMYSVNECVLNDVELKEIYIKTILKLKNYWIWFPNVCKSRPIFFSFFVYFTFPNLKKKQLLLNPLSIAIMPWGMSISFGMIGWGESKISFQNHMF